MTKDQIQLPEPECEIATHPSFDGPRPIMYLGHDRLPVGTTLYTAATVRRLITEAVEKEREACDEAKAKSRNHLFRSGLSIAAGVIRARSAAKSSGELPSAHHSPQGPAHPGIHALDGSPRPSGLARDPVPERVPPRGLERASELPAQDHQSGHRHISGGAGVCGGLAGERRDDGGLAT